jgi:UDP-N-acetylglucosamine 2-epimerase (non-hydrolysing)
MPYTDRSRDHLLREAFHPSRVYVTGNPIKEVMDYYAPQIEATGILDQLGLAPEAYFLVTLHRAENVDIPERLLSFLDGFQAIHERYDLPIMLSLHPRTRSHLEAAQARDLKGVTFIDPPGFFDFVHLEQWAKAVLSDSGTVQEEGCILGIPTVTLRDVTERPETIECGSNILSGCAPEGILRSLELVLSRRGRWNPPPEYLEKQVSRTVGNILMGFF